MGMMVSARKCHLSLVQVTGLRCPRNFELWNQTTISISPGWQHSGCEDTETGEVITIFSLCYKRRKKVNVLPEDATSANEKKKIMLHWESWRKRKSLRQVVGCQRRHQTDHRCWLAPAASHSKVFSDAVQPTMRHHKIFLERKWWECQSHCKVFTCRNWLSRTLLLHS